MAYVKVKVTPGTKKESFEQVKENVFVAKVKESARMNLANRRIIVLVASHFKVATGKVRIVNGHRRPTKLLSIDV